MPGQISRAVRRSEPFINDLANFFERRRTNQGNVDRRERLKNLFTDQGTEPVIDRDASTLTNQDPAAREIPIEQATMDARRPAGEGPFIRPGGSPAPMNRQEDQPTQAYSRMKQLTPAMVPEIGNILNQTPEAMLNTLFTAQDAERKRDAGRYKTLGADQMLYDVREGEAVTKNPRTFPPQRPDQEWVKDSDGVEHYRVPIAGDTKLRTGNPPNTSAGKRWVMGADGKEYFRVPVSGDKRAPNQGSGDKSAREKNKIDAGIRQNQKLKQQMRQIDSGLFKDANGEVVEKGTPAAKALKDDLARQVRENERQIEQYRTIVPDYNVGEGIDDETNPVRDDVKAKLEDLGRDAYDEDVDTFIDGIRTILDGNNLDTSDDSVAQFLKDNPDYEGEDE